MREQNLQTLIGTLVRDTRHGWNIGCFGAMGEFMWDPRESVEYRRQPDRVEIATRRGAMRITPTEFVPMAWETLSADGRGWGHVLAFC